MPLRTRLLLCLLALAFAGGFALFELMHEVMMFSITGMLLAVALAFTAGYYARPHLHAEPAAPVPPVEFVLEPLDDTEVIAALSTVTEKLRESVADLERLTRVTAATKQQASNAMTTVLSTMQSTGYIAAASEKITDAIDALSDRFAQSQPATEQAFTQVSNAEHALAQLHAATAPIHAVVAAITQTASELNMLALNAAIEAARSNDTNGMAAEAKAIALSAEHSSATIGAQLGALVQAATAAVTATRAMVGSVQQLTAFTDDAAELIETQRSGAEQIAKAIAETTRNVQDISRAIGLVDKAMEETGSASKESLTTADQLRIHAKALSASLPEAQANQA